MQPKTSPEDVFREALKDAVAICKALSRHCVTTDDLIGMANLALENDGQLRLLMNTVTGSQQKTR